MFKRVIFIPNYSMIIDTIDFYTHLKTNNAPLRELLNNKEAFAKLPDDWHVLVVDVKDPTIALENGLHNDVNLVATGSIITVLNIIKSISKEIQIPYFFRGDGTTFIVPNVVLEKVLAALETYGVHISKNLNLEIRVGNMKVADVYQKGTSIGIAKLNLNKYLVTSIIYGNGIKVAERLIRDNFKKDIKVSDSLLSIDLEGMECRWDEIYPNEDEKKVICLLVMCNDERIQSEVFIKILDEINYIFGDLNTRTPITTEKLKLDASFRKMRKEMYARLGTFDRGYLLQNWMITYFGKYYFKYFIGGKDYLFRVTQLSDTIVLDGSINTIFSGTQKQLNQLKMLLDTLENDDKIVYGLHATYASIMSCYIEDREENHIHFVDGTKGGYVNASIHLKSKLNHKQDFRK